MYIGPKLIKDTKETGEITPGGFPILEVEYEDGTIERFSKTMYDKIVSEETCDLTKLREKRIMPVVEMCMVVLRDWGIKIGELPYFSALVNQSLDFNTAEAEKQLWGKWMPLPMSKDEVDLLVIDRILKSSEKKTLDEVIG